MPRWALELAMAKETGQYEALGVNLRSYIWKIRQAIYQQAQNKSYELEPKK